MKATEEQMKATEQEKMFTEVEERATEARFRSTESAKKSLQQCAGFQIFWNNPFYLRTIVCSRSGPTETMVIGTSSSFSR